MTATKELQQIPALSGVGHQMKADIKAVEASRTSLQKAYDDLLFVTNQDAIDLRNQILRCMIRCTDLSYSANEKYSQND
jgi:hypothetical protein